MLQYTRITAFTVSELLRENQLGGRGNITLPPLPLRLRFIKKNSTFEDVFVTVEVNLWNGVNEKDTLSYTVTMI